MTAKNDITGDAIQSRANTKAFEDNFDAIFRKDKPVKFNDLKQLAEKLDEFYESVKESK